MALDGFEVWDAISENRRTFATLKESVTKSARACVVGYIKSKTFDIVALREVSTALGKHNFGLILDGMSPKDVKSLSGKLDKHNKEIKETSPQSLRQHIFNLAFKSLEPIAAPARRTRNNNSKGSGMTRRKGYVSAGVIRKT